MKRANDGAKGHSPVSGRWPSTYLLRAPAAPLPLRAARLFFRSRVVVRRVAARPKLLDWGPQTSENISHPPRAAMRREAPGLLRARLARIGRTSSPKARGFTPPSRSLTKVVGET